jgi:hypothetical protein
MVLTDAGAPALDPSQGERVSANPNAWDGTQFVYSPNQDKSLLPEGSWVAFDIPSFQDPGLASVTDFGVALSVIVSRTWSGTFYIDDVQLQ